jgi:hypothetical protein
VIGVVGNTMQRRKKAAFLAAFAECGNVSHAADIAGIDRVTHYRWLRDADYKAAYEDARERAADALEGEARRRAIEGVKRLRFGRGGEPLIDPETGQPYAEREYSDTLLIFLLKGIRPEKYRDNVRAELVGDGGGPMGVVVLPAVASMHPAVSS